MRKSFAALMFAVVIAFSTVTWAQNQDSERGFSAQNFQSSPGHGAFLTVEGSDVPDGVGVRLGGMVGYQYKPLVIRGCLEEDGGSCVEWADSETALIKHYVAFEGLFALSFFRVFELGLAVPVVVYQTGDDVEGSGADPGLQAPTGKAGIQDLRLHLKLDLLHGLFGYEGDTVGLALVPVVTFPVAKAANDGSFMGDSSVTVHPKLSFGINAGRVRIGLNAGYVWREEKSFYLAEMGPRISYGGAVEVSMTDHVAGIVEVFGQNGFSTELSEMPLEGDGALRFSADNGIQVTVGGGAGIIAGVGTPAARAFVGLMWSPPIDDDRDNDGILNEVDTCPDNPEDKDDFEDEDGCPDSDNDKDKIKDTSDNCPNDPEDRDEFEDKDGCPDPDNDKDGILDADDECPDEAEDKDEFEDTDGCPDPDNDKDGILDVDDKCPNKAEDKDKFEDDDGCPDPDNDMDGIPDVTDQCPNEKEVINNFEDEDGCPDKGEQLVVVKENKIQILQKIHFAFAKAKIKKISYPILDAVVSVLKANPEMNIRIEGHTDSKGKRKLNMKLSEKRAKAVLKYLVKAGIDPDNLTARGLGPDNPIDTNKTKDGRAANRRVEFHITNR